jgi:putative transposase
MYPNVTTITRLVGALLLQQNDEWQLQRRYTQLEGLQSLSTINALGCQPSMSPT